MYSKKNLIGIFIRPHRHHNKSECILHSSFKRVNLSATICVGTTYCQRRSVHRDLKVGNMSSDRSQSKFLKTKTEWKRTKIVTIQTKQNENKFQMLHL